MIIIVIISYLLNPVYNHFRIFFVFFDTISFIVHCRSFRFSKATARRIMQIFVRTLDDRTLTLDVQHDDTINDVKEIVEQREGKINNDKVLSCSSFVFRYPR